MPLVLAKALDLVYHLLAGHLAHRPGFRQKEAVTGAVTRVQRCSIALSLNFHPHPLCPDGVYAPDSDGDLRFVRVQTVGNAVPV